MHRAAGHAEERGLELRGERAQGEELEGSFDAAADGQHDGVGLVEGADSVTFAGN